jgi:hypothetical protein
LKPSWTAYSQWGVKGRSIPLQFSKSGDSNIEEVYATHYVMISKVGEKNNIEKGQG